MSTYYLAVNGQPAGPYTIEQLSQYNLAPDALVWNESMPNWAPASSIAELQVLFLPKQPAYQYPAYQQPAYQQPVYQQPEQNSYDGAVAKQKTVGLIDAIKRGFQNYVNFNGRASRSEFWFFQLFYFVGYLSMWILALAINSFGALTLPFIFVLGLLLPNLSLTWRRLHDTGRSGGYFFMSFIPFAGPIILLIAVCNASEPYENDYGPVPNVE